MKEKGGIRVSDLRDLGGYDGGFLWKCEGFGLLVGYVRLGNKKRVQKMRRENWSGETAGSGQAGE